MSSSGSEVRYTKDHEWVRLEGDIATIGISNHAQEALGDVVFVELPDVGRVVEEGESIATVESVKAASDIYAPLAGTVAEVNHGVVEEPGTVNSEPLDGGWFFKLSGVELEAFAVLMDEDEYTAFLESEAE
jgi:glycine cleavage system H protein